MLLVFEDERWQNFAPLSYTRPLFDLRCGAFTLRERIAALLASYPALSNMAQTESATHQRVVGLSLQVPRNPQAVASNLDQPVSVPAGLCRPHLMECYGPTGGIGALLWESVPLTLVNGRAVDVEWLPRLLEEPVGTVYESDGVLLGARISTALASVVLYYLREQQAAEALEELRRFTRVVEVRATLLEYPWHLITEAGEQLVRDMPLLAARLPRSVPTDPGVVVHHAEHVFVAPTAQLDGPLVLDARDGPIYIDEHAHIEPFSFIQGPAYIGRQTLISSARIRGESSFGPVCRIGGEVEASTIQSYSNKHHDGFLGHSWLGEWVNVGAMTTNSDLKNTYGTVRVSIEQQGQIDSGVLKLGCFLADHVKLGIGLHLTGGAVIGTGSNIFGIHMVPKNVPPFTWGSEVFYEYQLERMISVAQRVMARRKQELTPAYAAMLQAVFALTRDHRGASVRPLLQTPASQQSTAVPAVLERAETEAVRAYDYAL